MGSIPDQFPISLRAWPSKGEKTSQLSTLISRINAERGSFRAVSEETLQQEIDKGDACAVDSSSSDEDDSEDEPDKAKELMTAREEMLGQLEQAHHTSMIALDFVSLLLSKGTPVQASLSISPALRESVGLGTLGADRVSDSRITRIQKDDVVQIARGWKAQSLNENADSILAIAMKLEKDIEAETKYWKEVEEVSRQGWAVCALPQETHTLGVRFGFAEAAPAFRNRSLAALRRNPDGSVLLDQGIADSTPRRLRVRIQSNGITLGQMYPAAVASDDAPLLALVLRARNAIFVDELWQELNREGRALINHGVRCHSEEIICKLSGSKRIVLDLLPGGDEGLSLEAFDNHGDDHIANMVYYAIHLLLSYAHHQSYRRRSQQPPPISGRPAPNPPYHLLRPIIARMQYHSVVSTLSSLLYPLSKTLQLSGVIDRPCALSPKLSPPALKLSKPEQVIDALISNLEAEYSLPLTSNPPQSLTIRLRTTLYPLETRFNITAVGPLNEICKPPNSLASVEDVNQYILWATSCAVAESFVDDSVESEIFEHYVDRTDPSVSGTKGWRKTHNPVVLSKGVKDERDGKELSFRLETAPLHKNQNTGLIDKSKLRVALILKYSPITPLVFDLDLNTDKGKPEAGTVIHAWCSDMTVTKNGVENEVVALSTVIDDLGRSRGPARNPAKEDLPWGSYEMDEDHDFS